MKHPNLKNTRSGSPEKRAEYKASYRAKKRRDRAAFLAGDGFSRVPKIFGDDTGVYALVADYGTVRRINLDEVCHTFFMLERDAAAAGVLTQWPLPSGGGRGNRGNAVALNPAFPLFKELRALLRRLRKACDLRMDVDDASNGERVVPDDAARRFDVEVLFGGKQRTDVLATLEFLGGAANMNAIAVCARGYSIPKTERYIRYLVKDGVLARDKGVVSFLPTPWTADLRRLLKAYLEMKPELRSFLEQRVRAYREVVAARPNYGFFTRLATERMLVALALNGPMRLGRLADEMRTWPVNLTLKNFEEDGILVVARAPNATTISLNAAHPIYREFKAFLIGMSGRRPTAERPKDLRSEGASQDVAHLFSTRLRLDVLAMVAASTGGEIDVSSLTRLCPSHDRGVMRERLRQFEGKGILTSRISCAIRLYRLNPDYELHEELRKLLNKIVKIRPRYSSAAEAEEHTFSARRARRQRTVVASRPAKVSGRKPRS